MSEGKTGKKGNQQAPAEANSQPGSTWALYVVVAIVIAGAFWFYNHQQRIERAEHLARLEAEQLRLEALALQNEQAGLPETYPADFIPLYPGVELLEASAEDATADDGTPMDKWHVLSQIDEDKQVVYDFYKTRVEAEDLRQTMYISIPPGYSISYADENRIVELRIEKLSSDPMLQVEITIYVVKGKPASISPYDPSTAPKPAATTTDEASADDSEPADAAGDQAPAEPEMGEPTSDPPA